MAGKHNRLTARQVMTLGDGAHPDGGNLYLVVSGSSGPNTGARSWVYSYQLNKRCREMGLGSAYVFGLAEARQARDAARKLKAQGIDPLDQRAAEKAVEQYTFRWCADRCINGYTVNGTKVPGLAAGWRNPKHAAQWETTLSTYAYPIIGDKPVDQVTTDDIHAIVGSIWETKNETANRLRGRLETILDWARVKGYCKEDKENPARWRGHLDKLLGKRSAVRRVRHHPALLHSELPEFWVELVKLDGLASKALQFCILTATRTAEVIGAAWDEIDLDEAVWTVPAVRMKAKKEHRIPLSPAAVAILKALPGNHEGYLWPGLPRKPGRPPTLSNMAMLQTLRSLRPGLTVHGFRSTFRTWAAEETHFPADLCEAALAHDIKTKTEKAYDRGDQFKKRQLLMDAWATYTTTPRAAGSVVSLHAG